MGSLKAGVRVTVAERHKSYHAYRRHWPWKGTDSWGQSKAIFQGLIPVRCVGKRTGRKFNNSVAVYPA